MSEQPNLNFIEEDEDDDDDEDWNEEKDYLDQSSNSNDDSEEEAGDRNENSSEGSVESASTSEEDEKDENHETNYIKRVFFDHIISKQYDGVENCPRALSYEEYGNDMQWFVEDAAQIVIELLNPEYFSKSSDKKLKEASCIKCLPDGDCMSVVFKDCIFFPLTMSIEKRDAIIFDMLGHFYGCCKEFERPLKKTRVKRALRSIVQHEQMDHMKRKFKRSKMI